MSQGAENERFVYEFGKFVLDPQDKTIFVEGRAVHLPPKEFETLVLLVEHNGRALTKEEMMAALWHDTFVEEGNIATYISRLRKIFNADGERFIETVPKHGYRFAADLKKTVYPHDAPLVLEKRTVQRLTMTVQDEAEPPPSLPPAKRPGYRWLLLALPLIALIGLISLGWYFGQKETTAAVDPYEPVRLTDDPNDDTGPRWTADGRIRFVRIHPNNRHVTMIMNADGSGQSEINVPDGKRVFSWSPDEQKVLFQKQGDMTKTYLANTDGSGEVLLPFPAGNWSADSKMLTYYARDARGIYDIFVYFLDTGESRNLTNDDSFDADPSFSPDGKSVVFASGRVGLGEIYSIDLDGTNLRRLTFDPAIDAHPAYSPDGTVILFNSDRENENGDVYLMRADGTGAPVKITKWDKSNETAGPGGWSPDGTKIAFFTDRNGKDDIYVMSAESVRPQLVFSDPDHDLGSFSLSPDVKKIVFSKELEDKSGELRILERETRRTELLRKTELPSVSPVWSPDGNTIVFHDRIDGNSEICIINPDGSGFKNLTNDAARDAGPSWSRDGKDVAFVTSRGEPPGATRLYLMSADGSDPHAVTPRKGWESDPVWSPDGSLIFACDRQDVPGNLMDICQIGSDGSGEKRLLSRRNYDAQPAVSPDGKRIAFTATSDGNPEIYIMNSDGSELLRLTRHPADDRSPAWSPDGTKLLFLSNRTGRFAIYEIASP
jgi:TolB protein